MSRPKGVGAVLVLCVLGLFAAGCGDDNGISQEDLDAAVKETRDEAAKQAGDEEKLQQLQQQVKQLQKQARQNSYGSGDSQSNTVQGDGYYGETAGPVASCGAGVKVGPNTSCSFAMNVAGEYGSNPGATSIRAYSEATGKQYLLACGPWGEGTVCSGGNGAAVYLP